MLHYIENEYLSCAIESVGAEIRSLKDKESGREYIWQIKHEVWGSSSPVLFPAIGSIKEGKWQYQGASYAMTKHGIIRNNTDLEFEATSQSACSFSLRSSKETKERYPFDFDFKVRYKLVDRSLEMIYDIENTGSQPLPFICGGHTAYACPIDNDTALTDYVVEFPGKEVLVAETLAESGLLGYKQREYQLENGALNLSESLFNDDALIFANIGIDHCILRKKSASQGVKVQFGDYPHLALWSKPGADYVCIEPWLGLPDREDESLEPLQKRTFHVLPVGELFSCVIRTHLPWANK